MLQQDKAEDYVVAIGKQVTVRDFEIMAAHQAGMELTFEGSGVDEIAKVASVSKPCTDAVKVGDVILRVDPRYFRPAEVETLLSDPSKAQKQLVWTPSIAVEEMCAERVAEI